MKKLILLISIGLLTSTLLYAQKNEYRYLALKFGLSNGFSPKPGFNENKYLYTPVGQMQVSPTGSKYVPGFVFDILYHFDFTTDNAGIYTGLEYNFSGIGAKYNTRYGNYTLDEIHRYHSVGLPLAFKYGPDIWKTQRYLVLGAQVNMILTMSAVQKANFSGDSKSRSLTSAEYNRMFFNFFAAVNYSAFNIQIDYFPKSLFNKKFETATTPTYLPYDEQVDVIFAVKATVNVPYGWLSEKSFWWRKFLRKTPWR